MSAAPLLEAVDLSKSFGGVRALSKVNFKLNKGDLMGVIGPNGSGKTTLVNSITRFVKPSSGKVLFKGEPIQHLSPHKIVCLGIARTFQMVRPFYQLPAYKNMIIPLYSPRVKGLVGGRYGDRNAKALDLLEEVGFERDAFVAYKPAGSLPQGYLKRLELAKAIALQPELVILDELFSGLSLAEVASIVPIIDKMRHQGKTIIMIEHRLRELFRIADRVIVMNYGEKIADGTPDTVMEDDAVKSAYLGSEKESGESSC
jgi:branched-chain amino acid transport system ATP-binding protein